MLSGATRFCWNVGVVLLGLINTRPSAVRHLLLRVLYQYGIANFYTAGEGKRFSVSRPAIRIDFFCGQAGHRLWRSAVDRLPPKTGAPITVGHRLAVRSPAYPKTKVGELWDIEQF